MILSLFSKKGGSIKGAAPVERKKRRVRPISQRTITLLLSTWTSQLAAGVTYTASTESLASRLERRSRGPGKKQAEHLRWLSSRFKNSGETAANVLAPYLTDTENMVLDAGERSGDLGLAADRVLNMRKQGKQIKSALTSAMVAPVIYILTLIATMLIISKVVVPQLSGMLPPEQWAGSAKALYVSAQLVEGFGLIYLAIGLVLTWLLIKLSLPRWTGTGRILAERFFPVYTLYRDYQGTMWLTGFSSLMSAGMSDVDALGIQVRNSSPWMAERLGKLRTLLRNGYSLADALLYAGIGRVDKDRPERGTKFDFPSPNIVDEVGIFAGFSDFSEKMIELQHEWNKALVHKTESLVNKLGFFVQLLIFGYFFLLTIGVNQLSSQIGSAVTG